MTLLRLLFGCREHLHISETRNILVEPDNLKLSIEGRNPVQVVMGGDSRSEGCGIESRHRILDVHFFTYICYENSNDVCLKRTKVNNKR